MIEIEKILTKQIEDNKSPSVHYIIFDKDAVIHEFQYGFADILNQKKVNENSTYNAFSITKTFTALAILQLEEKGMLNIDDSVKQHLPNFPYSDDITIRQLLTHSAGIPNPIPLNWIHLTSEHKEFNREEFFEKVFENNKKTKFKPNKKFSYSNLGYVILGQLIEKVSGMTYQNYININILKVLDIPSSELGFTIDTTQQVKGYQKRISFSNIILGFLIDKSKYMEKSEGKWKPFKNMYVNGESYGGLIGLPRAFMKYIQDLLNPNSNLLTNNSKEKLFTENFSDSKKGTGMCLSWFKGELDNETYFTHAGGGGGYYCEIRIYPEIGIGSVIMFNRTGMKDERFLDKTDKYVIKGKQTSR